MPEGIRLVGFADDTIIIVETLEEHALEIKIEESIAIVERLASRGLTLAVQKTEAVLVTRWQAYRSPKLVISPHQDKLEEAAGLPWCRGR